MTRCGSIMSLDTRLKKQVDTLSPLKYKDLSKAMCAQLETLNTEWLGLLKNFSPYSHAECRSAFWQVPNAIPTATLLPFRGRFWLVEASTRLEWKARWYNINWEIITTGDRRADRKIPAQLSFLKLKICKGGKIESSLCHCAIVSFWFHSSRGWKPEWGQQIS